MSDDIAVAESTTTTTSAPESAPAQSSEPEPMVTTDRPSMKDALTVFNEAAKQQGRKPRGPQPVQYPAPTGTPAATAPEGTTQPETPKGPIPFDVHDTALKNARAKERAAVEQEVKAKYAHVDALLPYATQFQTDRTGFIATIVNEALQDPQLAPQILSLAGQALRGSQAMPPAQSPASLGDPPAPDFQDANGNRFYSADAQAKRDEWFAQKLKAEILGTVQPDLDRQRAREERETAQAEESQRFGQIAQYREEAKASWPYFEQHKAEIREELTRMPLTDGHPASEAWALQRAYQKVVGPKLSSLEQARVVADLKARANASTLNPAATGSSPGIPKNVSAKTGGTMADALKWAAGQQSGR